MSSVSEFYGDCDNWEDYFLDDLYAMAEDGDDIIDWLNKYTNWLRENNEKLRNEIDKHFEQKYRKSMEPIFNIMKEITKEL